MKALLLIDIQYDFLPGGALAVPNGDDILRPVNNLIPHFDCIILTQDWHPANHTSFASNNERKSPYETVEMDYGTQVLWPDHCVQGTKGAEIHPEIKADAAQLIIRKGFRPHIDSYSAFFENDHKTPTGLDGYLQERNVKQIFACGLATDFCVKFSAIDAIKKGYKFNVVEDAVRGIDLDNSVENAVNEMKNSGVQFLSSNEIISSFG